MPTAREFLFEKGLTKAPTGRGRFSREANAVLDAARKAGTVFSDDTKPEPKAKTVKVEKTPKTVAVKPTERYDNSEVRKWARENGHNVGERGRIHVDVINAYLEATDASERPEVTTELDVFGPTFTGRYPAGTKFVAEFKVGDKDYRQVVGDATACYNCRCSLSGHKCNAPAIVTGYGIDPVAVRVEYPKGA